jgi:hypothetical protein
MKPIEIIELFDKFLTQRNLKFEAIVIGGGALSILGIIARETQDIDILDPKIPKEILDASIEFSKINSISLTTLKENWLNNGPDSLKNFLRKDWYLRLENLYDGKSIKFKTLGRLDLIGTKLLAYCDRGTDLKDCIDLNPTIGELNEILPWVKSYDSNPDWPQYVEKRIFILKEKLGHGI